MAEPNNPNGLKGVYVSTQAENDPDLLDSSLITFAEETLGFDLYGWQCDAIEPLDYASERLVLVTLATPNGSGKTALVIPTAVLGWLALYPKGRVVYTTADGKQLDGQLMPALQSHRSKFPEWTFIEREIRTPTGGFFYAFTTDQAGRAEGWHKLDNTTGPLLMIVDEAKSVRPDIFEAVDRCTYNAILLTSSPGKMVGRFYESQTREGLGYVRVKAGLADCPHIGQDKIDRLNAQYGPDGATPNPEFLRSTLHGEFMAADGEARFNREGLELLTAMAQAGHSKAEVGELVEQRTDLGLRGVDWLRDQDTGWVWRSEAPIVGCKYLGWCDPMTGAQSEGSLDRDTHAAGILRDAYTDTDNVFHEAQVVAVLHHAGGCRWDNDILAERLSALLRHYGDCMAIVEANNSGTEVIGYLQQLGRTLYRRMKRDHRVHGKKLETVGFLTTSSTKANWVGALARYIREQAFVCCYEPAVNQFGTFILNEKGNGEAQAGCKDDFCAGIGLGLYALEKNASVLAPPQPTRLLNPGTQGVKGPWT